MRKTIYIHIGPHKTGTSSLQHFLHDRRKRLLTEGVLFPAENLKGLKTQHRVAFALRGMRDKFNDEFPDVGTELANLVRQIEETDAPVVIISSEAFFAIKAKAIGRLRDELDAYDVKIVFYARRQDEAFASTFSQRVKSPRSPHIAPIHDGLAAPAEFAPDLDLYNCASRWAKRFGKTNMIMRVYAEAGDIREDFMSAIGRDDLRDLAHEASDGNVNVSPSLEALEYLRAFKITVADQKGRHKALTRLTSHFAATGRKPIELLSMDDRRRLLEHFREDNERLFAEFLGRENAFSPALIGDAQKERVVVDTSDVDVLMRDLLSERAGPFQPETKGAIAALFRRILKR
ncbi:MAG: hypothetical protein LPK88_14040 [Alphaproteobacteria bacterium]|nr:hypothetical protein [Alphaproteobacteria bacterium]MDX5417424.1 hypothetical protein [Alphaproteobacteria bacterium]MDX5494897.1 hypothetical protein [Alphaproteobacteria bacterium]